MNQFQDINDKELARKIKTGEKRNLLDTSQNIKAFVFKVAVNTIVEQSMSCRIAGVQVQENSVRPGGNKKIAIRGYSSFNASNEPLYVVDGIIWPQGIGAALNSYDIETIDVLKDASSTAI